MNVDICGNGICGIAGIVPAVRRVGILQLQDAGAPVDGDLDAGVVIDHPLVVVPEHVQRGLGGVEDRTDEAQGRSGADVQIWSAYDFRRGFCNTRYFNRYR